MPEIKIDGRIRYTKMVIRNSLISLLREKPIAKVTVTEICKGAGINRATFYAHYADPFDLLRSIEREIVEDITAQLEGAFTLKDSDLRGILVRLISYIQENAGVFSVLLSDNGDTGFLANVVSMIEKQFIAERTKNNAVTRENAEYLYTFAANGCVGIIRKWLDEGMKKSVAEMAEFMVILSNKGYSGF